jgi:Raf kinase inhibitor-like YbhB/YbcL family protein
MNATPSDPGAAAGGLFTLSSTAFAEGEAIPREFSCQGENVSPPLSWTGVPAGTAGLVLVVDDPDAGGYVHWIVLDLPGSDGELPRGVDPMAASPQQGRNGWSGPCPPSGTHHYNFTLTALGAPLNLADRPSASAVQEALAGAPVVGTAVLTGTYGRSQA